MHHILTALESELRQIATTVKNSSGNDHGAGMIHGSGMIASVDRHELSLIAENLANRIADEGGEELKTNEKQLSQYQQRLTFLRENTVPNLLNGNGNCAIPAYLFTLEALKQALGPALQIDLAEISGDTKTARVIQTKLRGLESRIAGLEPKIIPLQAMVNQIVQAHAAADQLPTDLETLREAQEEIQSLRKKAADDQAKINELFESVKQYESTLQSDILEAERELNRRKGKWIELEKSTTDTAKNIIDRCEDAMRTSTSYGLAGAFHDQARSLHNSMWVWVVGLILALISGAVVGSIQLDKLFNAIQTSPPPMIILARLIISLLAIGAPVWFAWLSTKQIGQRFRLSQDYAYKASVSKSYEGYRREALQLDADFQTRLFSTALARLDEQPLRFVEHETHGSPWHELFASDLFKEAIRIAPDLVGKFSEMAREKVDATKKSKAKPKATEMAGADTDSHDGDKQ